MAGTYKKFLLAQLNGTESVDLGVDRIDAVLCRTSGGGGTPYSVNYDTDEFLSDIPTAGPYARVATVTSITLTPSVGTGQFEIQNTGLTFTSPSGTDPAHIIVFYKYNASEAAARLLFSTDVSVTPDGNDINVTFSGNIVNYYINP